MSTPEEEWVVPVSATVLTVSALALLRCFQSIVVWARNPPNYAFNDTGVLLALALSSALHSFEIMLHNGVFGKLPNYWLYCQASSTACFVLACCLVTRKWTLLSVRLEFLCSTRKLLLPDSSFERRSMQAVRFMHVFAALTLLTSLALLLAQCILISAGIEQLLLYFVTNIIVNTSLFVMFAAVLWRVSRLISSPSFPKGAAGGSDVSVPPPIASGGERCGDLPTLARSAVQRARCVSFVLMAATLGTNTYSVLAWMYYPAHKAAFLLYGALRVLITNSVPTLVVVCVFGPALPCWLPGRKHDREAKYGLLSSPPSWDTTCR